jgi:predicted nuclease with TOPRIM domain
MSLIEVFTDHIRNRKSLKDYVEVRKTLNERGEFNDSKLIQAEENLQRLKKENLEIYERMYDILEEVYRRDRGHHVEYPINFTQEVLKMYDGSSTPEQVCEGYERVLNHRYRDA